MNEDTETPADEAPDNTPDPIETALAALTAKWDAHQTAIDDKITKALKGTKPAPPAPAPKPPTPPTPTPTPAPPIRRIRWRRDT